MIKPPRWYKKTKERKFLKKFEGREKSKKLNLLGKNILKANNISHINISFYVLKSNVINAFATENNEVYITEGILKFFAHEEKFIAAVLSHEIAHIMKGHIKKNQKFISKINILSSILPRSVFGSSLNYIFKGAAANYSKENELEADNLSVKYLYFAGYNPIVAYLSLKKLYENIKEKDSPIEDFFSSHPISTERLEAVKSEANNIISRD